MYSGMKCRLAAGAVAAVAAAASAGQQTFNLPFENRLVAEAAGEGKPAEPVRGVSFVPGIRGMGARFVRPANLHYAFVRNACALRGTVAFWFKPDDGLPRASYLPLFYFDRPAGAAAADVGTGRITLLYESDRLQARVGSDSNRFGWESAPADLRPCWRHIALTWDLPASEMHLYVDGREYHKKWDGAAAFSPPFGKMSFSDRRPSDGFRIGMDGDGGSTCHGTIDEFTLDDEPLFAEAIRAKALAFKPVGLDLVRHYALAGRPARVEAELRNLAAAPLASEWRLEGPVGQRLAASSAPVPLASGAVVPLAVDLAAPVPGRYRLTVCTPGKADVLADFWVLPECNAAEAAPGSELALEPVLEMNFDRLPPAGRFTAKGAVTFRELNGRRYLETGSGEWSRLACRLDLPAAPALYCLDWEWPDDKPRFADLVLQPALGAREHYELQVGYVTGGPIWPPSGKMVRSRQLYWAPSTNAVFILSTLRPGEPAAVASLRISRIKGDALPSAEIREPAIAEAGRRTFGIYFEDPAVIHDFAAPGEGDSMPAFGLVVDRLAAYLKATGQNCMSYPGVWYEGALDGDYQPRPHPEAFLEAFYTRFDAEGLGFMPSLNYYCIPYAAAAKVAEATLTNGSWNATCVNITADGKPNPGSCHTPPTYNPLHPETQEAFSRQVAGLLRQGAPHPSFKGVDIYFHTSHNLPWFGNIRSGYNDSLIDGFTAATGIRVPVSRSDPMRGKKYAEWLLANAYQPWVDWRCRGVADFIHRLAAQVAAARPGLQLALTVQSLVEYEKADWSLPHVQMRLMKEAGLDPALLTDIPNLILRQGSRPVGPSVYNRVTDLDAKTGYLLGAAYTAEYWEPLTAARRPEVNLHDHYWESDIGSRDPLVAPWFREIGWRVSAVNPLGAKAMKAYAAPLRYGDILGITRGGFLIGTYGIEDWLVPFAKAFRALPAVRFADLPCSTPTLKCRAAEVGGKRWFYAVNTGDAEASVSIPCGGRPVTDLVSGLPVPAGNDGAIALTLAPYQLRSFVQP